jgi:uncharacterized membrane protein (DUF485 family)
MKQPQRMSKRRLTVILVLVALAFYVGFILLSIYRSQ